MIACVVIECNLTVRYLRCFQNNVFVIVVKMDVNKSLVAHTFSLQPHQLQIQDSCTEGRPGLIFLASDRLRFSQKLKCQVLSRSKVVFYLFQDQ